jgi:hypothetical protein
MSFEDLLAWIEAHPWQAALIGGVGVLVILWLFGFFGSSSQQSSGDGGLMSAYYAAEAQQASVGAQLQAHQDDLAAATNQAQIQANAAEAIATTAANMQTTINSQNVTGAEALGADQLFATYSNNATVVTTNAANNAAATAIAGEAAHASIMTTFLDKVVPLEIKKTGGTFGATIDGGSFSIGRPGKIATLSPKRLKQLGYTSAQYKAITGLPGY